MPPRPLHELKANFDRIGQRKIFGEGRNRDIETTLQRISNSKPNDKTKDYARRIIDVFNGKGREDDIKYFKLLLRRFEDASGIKARTLITFLRRSKAPENRAKFPAEVAALDRNALQYSTFLEQLNLLTETIELKENGEIITKPKGISSLNNELYLQYMVLRKQEVQKAEQWIKEHSNPDQLRNTISRKVVFGTVVVIFDSRIGLPYGVSGKNARGFYERASKGYPAFVHVDINPENRPDGVSPKTSLVHELRHSLFDIFKRLMINDPHNPVASATLKLDTPEIPFGFRSKKELIDQDKKLYTYLLNREPTVEDYENITKQRAYMDELHSSILQRKDNWFNWSNKVYSTEMQDRFHSELVGNHPEDVAATRNMFCYLQGFYILEKLVKESLDPNSSWHGKISPRFAENVSKYFNRAGSLIATSLTVQQASRLVGEMWRLFLKQHPKAPIEYLFNQLPKDYVGQPSNGQSIGKFLMPK